MIWCVSVGPSPRFFNHSVLWIQVTDVADWEAIPFEGVRLEGHGIVMHQTGESVPLLLHCLRSNKQSLTEDDLRRCCESLKISTDASNDTKSLLTALAKHFCGDDDHQTMAELFIENQLKPCAADASMLDDPLVEAVYDDLDPEDKTEFPEIAEARKQRKVKSFKQKWQAAIPVAKRRRLIRPRRPRIQPPAPLQDLPAHPLALCDGLPPEPAAIVLAGATQPSEIGAPALAAEPGAIQLSEIGAPALVGEPGSQIAAPDTLVPLGPAVHSRGPRLVALIWTDFPCPVCHKVAGQYKFHPSPGGRDGASWLMRVWDRGAMKWGHKLPLSRTQRESTMTEEDGTLIDPETYVQRWITNSKTCCS